MCVSEKHLRVVHLPTRTMFCITTFAARSMSTSGAAMAG